MHAQVRRGGASRPSGLARSHLLTLAFTYVCRNGGHISPPLYHDWASLQSQYRNAAAEKMIKFRLAHLHEFRKVAEEEGILEACQWREVDIVDAYYEKGEFDGAKVKLRKYQQDLPFEASHHRVYEAPQAREVLQHGVLCSGWH